MSRPKIALIAAVAKNGVIGRDNTLPWRLPEDLKRFKALTLGHPIIMGRKTWDSLGRPLPGRENIVITRQAGFAAEGARVVHGLQEAIEACADKDTAFIIGGAQLYTQALPQADLLFLTEVDAEVEGDALFPPFDRLAFSETARAFHAADERHDHAYSFVDYARIPA
ncbi:MAG: dihydrofolate reductase [Moraxellaceae bacterium]|nr:dihydrofolate reductase [Moraxellaceae bacterium]